MNINDFNTMINMQFTAKLIEMAELTELLEKNSEPKQYDTSNFYHFLGAEAEQYMGDI